MPRIGRPPRVGLDEILDAAVRLGLSNLTMRGLAKELGVGASTLYHHVASKEELMTLLGAHLLERLQLSLGTPGDWEATMRRAAVGLRGLFEQTPGLAASAVADPRWGDAVVALHEQACAHLVRAGFTPAEAWLSVRALADFVEDFVVRRQAQERAGITDLAHAARYGGPTLRAAHAALGDEHHARRFDAGIDRVVRGIRARRRARAGALGYARRSSPGRE